MTYDSEAIVRYAYHMAEGAVLDVAGFVDSFTEDGVFNDVVGQESYRGEQLGDVLVRMAQLLPDVHRELHRVTVAGDVVAVELSIQGTFRGPMDTPAGIIGPTGAKIDVPTADDSVASTTWVVWITTETPDVPATVHRAYAWDNCTRGLADSQTCI